MANVFTKEKVVASSKFAIKFLIGTAISYAINIVLTFVLTELMTLPYIVSYSISQVVQILFSFFYNSKIIFKSGVSKFIFAKYLLVLVSVAVANIYTVKFLTDYIGIYYLYSITISLTFYTVVKYTIYNFFVFDRKNKTQS